MRNAGFVALSATMLVACSFAPKYERPTVELPETWRAPSTTQKLATPSDRWWSFYADPALDRLVDEAFAHNQDLALAVARVDEAQALVRVQESQQWPSVDATAGGSRSRASTTTDLFFPGVPVYSTDYRAALNIAYEVDLWGRLRNATAAARADLLATEGARDTVRIALAAQVVRSYYALRAFDGQVDATERSIELRSRALDLQRQRALAGLIAELDVRSLEAEVAAARADLPALLRDRALEEAALAVLLGRSPRGIIDDSVARLTGPDVDEPATVVPAGLPSELLLRRPDLFEAEQRLVAASARIGVARAAFFPQIALTGYLGTEAASLGNLFTGPAGIWQFAGALAQPIFQGGRLFAETDAAEARQRQALAQYQKTVQTAFREVRDALNTQTRAREIYEAEGTRVDALREVLKLSYARYQAGLVNLLVPIDAERNLLQAQLLRINAFRQQRAAIADLFQALGGGWTAAEDAPTATSKSDQQAVSP